MNTAWRVMRRDRPQMLSRINLRITAALGIIFKTGTASERRRFWVDCTTNIDWWRPHKTEDRVCKIIADHNGSMKSFRPSSGWKSASTA